MILCLGRCKQMSAHSGREFITDKSQDWWANILLRKVSSKSMGEGLLSGARMTQRQLHHQKPPLPTAWVGGHSQKLGTSGSLHSLQIAQQVGECSFQMIGWSEPLPVSSAGLCFFQGVQPVWVSVVLIAYIYLGREGARGDRASWDGKHPSEAFP